MMVETILEYSQDFGMSNGSLPQWKRELLQRRAARSRPAPAAPPEPPPPPPLSAPPADEDEELRYGPGIVKRLKSRYLSLALRETPRRRPSVLRRATSLEHLLDERPPPAPRPHSRPARPVSFAAPTHPAFATGPPPRRDSVKRARSVDALSRLDSRDERPALQPQPRPRPPPSPTLPHPPPLPPSPPPPLPKCARPPRRPVPLLRDTERPPPDVVRSTLRKFECAPPRKPAPSARVSAVLRGLEALPRSSTPEPSGRSPSPAAADLSAIDEPEGGSISSEVKQVSRAALEGIARAGSTVRYSFEAPKRGSHLPPLAATNPVLLNRVRLASPRRIGVIKPMPAVTSDSECSSPTPTNTETREESPRLETPPPDLTEPSITPRPERREPPPSALVEPIPRAPPEENIESFSNDSSSSASGSREPSPEPDLKPDIQRTESPKTRRLRNGHVTQEKIEAKLKSVSRIGTAGIERAWTGAGAGAGDKKCVLSDKDKKENGEVKSVVGVGIGVGARKLRPPAPAATSVVFNFSDRKEVPDYIENDGIILRANRRNRFKAGEAGIVVLRAETPVLSDSEGEEESRPPSPCRVRFLNDNVLINGRSSLAVRTARKERAARLKLQFDDSLTRTFEYPSETSLCEESAPPSPPPATPAPHLAPPAPHLATPAPHLATLAPNTHLSCGSSASGLSHYTPSKTLAEHFQLGMTPTNTNTTGNGNSTGNCNDKAGEGEGCGGTEAGPEGGDARPCAAESARSWSEARTHATDLLF